MARVLVVGSVNMDVIAPMRRLPDPGETLLIDDVRLAPGGKGANTAVAAARMGAEVRFVGCVGDDAFGHAMRDHLVHEGIDCSALRLGERGTGTAVILLNTANAQNAIMVGPGANACVELPKRDELFTWADIVMLQLETPLALNVMAAQRAREADVPVILDPAPAVADLPDDLLRSVTCLSPNESELSMLTGMTVNSLDSAEAAARALLRRGAEQVVVKLAEKGALWVTTKECHYEAAPVIEAVDTTAAGDAFTGALAVGLADDMPMPAAMQRACLVGALTCTKLGAQPSIPTREQADAFDPGNRTQVKRG